MLPDPTVLASLLAVLDFLRGCFTYPTFQTFAALVTGLIATTGRGTVTGMLTGAGLSRLWSHDRAHAFFSRAAWDPQTVGLALSHLVVRQLLPAGAALTVAVDDTLFKRRGKKVFGAVWQHDGAATGPKPVGRGTCFVHIPARLARTARIKLTAHLPVNWPWRDAYQDLFQAVHHRPAPG